MRHCERHKRNSSQALSSCRRLGSGARSLLALRACAAHFAALFAALALLPGTMLAAQTPPRPPAAAPAHKPAIRARNPPPPSPRASPRQASYAAGASPAQTSRLARKRSSLRGIRGLGQPWPAHRGFQLQPGADPEGSFYRDRRKLEGMDQDQRIFGTYGPGPARDVLSQLLDGSGYNVLMIGDRGQGTPRRIVLSAHSGGGGAAPPAASPQARQRRGYRRRSAAQEPAAA